MPIASYPLWASSHELLNSDWTNFATGAHLLLSNPHQLYDLAAQRRVQAQIIGGGAFSFGGYHGLLPFLGPPWVAMLAAPFTALGDVAGGRVWTLAEVLAYAGGIYLLAPAGRRSITLSAVASAPAAVMVLNAQVDGLVVLGLGLAWSALEGRRETAAGLALGLTLFKPQLVLPLAAAVLLGRRWRILAAWAATAVVLALAAEILDRRMLRSWLGAAGGPTGANLGLPGLAPGSGHLWLIGILAVAGVVATLFAARGAGDPEGRAGVLVAGGLAAAPHALGSDFVLLPAAVALGRDGGLVLWLVISALSLVSLFVRAAWLSALVSVVLVAAVIARQLGIVRWWGKAVEKK